MPQKKRFFVAADAEIHRAPQQALLVTTLRPTATSHPSALNAHFLLCDDNIYRLSALSHILP